MERRRELLVWMHAIDSSMHSLPFAERGSGPVGGSARKEDRETTLFLSPSGLGARAAEAAMKRAGTNIRPDQPALAVVTDGPFRFTRNPLYLATTGLYLAVTLLFNALWPLVLLPFMLGILEWGVIRREERYLEAKFGAPYREYRARVRRWL